MAAGSPLVGSYLGCLSEEQLSTKEGSYFMRHGEWW